ncbi:MAG: family 10 glycosylhydrolase [Chitinophagales bacterium]|nr:family 10 glycosylhydrolase [Chitinophagales bacterium]
MNLFYKYSLLSLVFSLISHSKLISQPNYEFRGVWIATVDNIDWPVKGMVNADSQKAEYIRQLDLHKKNGMNAVIVQVRPSADAFYPSPYEPWSQWLAGTQGKPPSPYYDPLQFLIKEAHKRGMEFHAWCNPYRADFKIDSSSIAPSHITRIHPEWFLTYGDKKYFDPANKEAQEFVVSVVGDIVNRYDIDAIHMDDYFYPYRISGLEFPDSISYLRSGTKLNKDDWRRSNVDSIIRMISLVIKKEKPWVQFGISPFSVWRNKAQDPDGSDSNSGQNNYDDLYADIVLWLKEKWIDYVAPQLYFEIGNSRVAFEKLLNWWSKHSYGRHLYIGMGIYRASGNLPPNSPWKNPNELPDQIKLLRQYPNVQGSIYFSSKTFNTNPNGWNDSLQNNYYKTPALIPPMEWLPMKPVRQ